MEDCGNNSDNATDEFSWSDEDESGFDNLEVGSSSTNQSNPLFQHFVGMGYSDKIVTRAIEENENANEDSVLNTILTFIQWVSPLPSPDSSKSSFLPSVAFCQCGFSSFIPTGNEAAETTPTKAPDGDSNLKNDCEDSDFMSSDDEKMAMESSPTRNLAAEVTLAKAPGDDSDFMWSDDEEIPEENYLDKSDCCPELEQSLQCSYEMKEKLSFLKEMQFPEDECLIAVQRCVSREHVSAGPTASVEELIYCIEAAQFARAEDHNYIEQQHVEATHCFKKKKTANGPSCSRRQSTAEDENTIRLPNPMIGFGVPGHPLNTVLTTRKLPEEAAGPPYFYYEQVACTPKGVWDEISRCLYGIMLEFVDSKYFYAAARKRGYVHNLPIENRFPILPIPPLTIQEALPDTKAWWPTWDQRTKLNCLLTAYASAKLTERIRKRLEQWNGVEPPLGVQKYVLYESRKWNLVWVGRNKVTPLDPGEVEMLLGFPKNHTRGGGISSTDRFKSLGSSFQVDTVAYHLSVLKRLFPNEIKVLSLFSGIGGAEVALHRLKIPLKVVVSVEKTEVNRSIMQAWWEQTNQVGNLVHMSDVHELTKAKLEGMVAEFGGFDLVVGGSPCNNLAGGNRHTRDGLEGTESRLFYEYPRILKEVRRIMEGIQV